MCKQIVSKILLLVLSMHLFFFVSIAHSLTIHDIPNKVFSLDLQDIDNDDDNSNDPWTGIPLAALIDNFNWHTWSQDDPSKRGIFTVNAINGIHPWLLFDGTNDLLDIDDSLLTTVESWYSEKSFSIVFKTWTDTTTLQTIYEQGTKEKGFAFQIQWGKLYAWAYNSLDWSSWQEYKVIDFWTIDAQKEYILIFVYDSVNNEIRASLNGIDASVVPASWEQKTHGACIFTAYFWCATYDQEGTIWLWATKNDSLNLSDNSTIVWYETNHFSGYLWEIATWNTALTSTEMWQIHTFLVVKWWFDSIPPVLSSDTWSGAIIPSGEVNLSFTYSDTHTGALGIDIASPNLELFSWNGSDFGTGNIISSYINNGSTVETLTWASYELNNIPLWKYKIRFTIADLAGNEEISEFVFYRDTPELIVGSWSVDLGDLLVNSDNFSEEVIITVKTIGAPFTLYMTGGQDLSYGITKINAWNGIDGFGYDQATYSWALSPVWSWQVIADEALNYNNSGALNNYTYQLKFWANPSADQPAGDYIWNVDFDINLRYFKSEIDIAAE